MSLTSAVVLSLAKVSQIILRTVLRYQELTLLGKGPGGRMRTVSWCGRKKLPENHNEECQFLFEERV